MHPAELRILLVELGQLKPLNSLKNVFFYSIFACDTKKFLNKSFSAQENF